MLKMYSQLKIVKKIDGVTGLQSWWKTVKTAKIDVFSPKIGFILDFYGFFFLQNQFYHSKLHKISQNQIKDHENKKILMKNSNFPTKSLISHFRFFTRRHSIKSLLLPQFSLRNFTRFSKALFLTYLCKRNFEFLPESEFLHVLRFLLPKGPHNHNQVLFWKINSARKTCGTP